MPARRGTDTFDDAAVDALERVVQAVRALDEAAVALAGTPAQLAELEREVRALEARMRPLATGKPLPRYRYAPFHEAQLNELLPYSPVTGRFHPHALPVEVSREAPGLVGRGTFGHVYEGPPDSVHGGVISAVYDQLLAMVNLVNGVGGYTASLTVSYRKKTPLEVETVWTCWTENVDGRKVRARGTCHAAGELVTEAEGLFVRAVEKP